MHNKLPEERQTRFARKITSNTNILTAIAYEKEFLVEIKDEILTPTEVVNKIDNPVSKATRL